MKFIIKDVIFTDKTKEGKELINKAGTPFWMLHLNGDLEVTKDQFKTIWASKFYVDNSKETKLKELIKVSETYELEIKQSGIYYNIVTLRDMKGNFII